ncbi:hypothetical protein D187_006064 [Cystobacter fuscus DSM 2262]|uniref:Uncharacterized protein n=1 Tax=Cystobacter fuscus (strain ATCC 25194 / DSM 2262 / NBRC 100088 / M29) TaxID=1242864 RepID=S9PKY7_CYSF2|nr:hypothetical protein D187_006064 [Cystobacter fuscus DSM 2262]
MDFPSRVRAREDAGSEREQTPARSGGHEERDGPHPRHRRLQPDEVGPQGGKSSHYKDAPTSFPPPRSQHHALRPALLRRLPPAAGAPRRRRTENHSHAEGRRAEGRPRSSARPRSGGDSRSGACSRA